MHYIQQRRHLLHFVDNDALPTNASYDLVISNYAFSEITVDEQINYINNVINKSKSGYMTCNFISDIFNLKSLTLDELLALMDLPNRKITLISEEPNTYHSNIVITWHEF